MTVSLVDIGSLGGQNTDLFSNPLQQVEYVSMCACVGGLRGGGGGGGGSDVRIQT